MKFYKHYKTDKDFNDFVIKTLKNKAQVDIPMKKILSLNRDFDNIIYHDNTEILIIPKEKIDEVITYEFRIVQLPKKIQIRFGCELEICFDLRCAEMVREKKLDRKSWKEDVLEYIKYNISPFLSKKFLRIFTYAYVMDYYITGKNAPKGYLVDMGTGEVIGRRLNDNDAYKTLIFTQDGSIDCENDNLLACEIITPVLHDLSILKLLYTEIGVKECGYSNETMGFHVNVSAVDEKGEIVELTRCMITSMLYNWLVFEQKNYRQLRGDDAFYAKSIDAAFDNPEHKEIVDAIVEKSNGAPITNKEYFLPYSLNIWMAERVINRVKYYSMTHWKQNNIVEHRIFPSTDNVDNLIKYTSQAIDNFESSILSYLSNPTILVDELQNSYVKYRYRDVFFKPFTSLSLYYNQWETVKLIFDVYISAIYNCSSLYLFKKCDLYARGLQILEIPKDKKLNTVLVFSDDVYYKYDFEIDKQLRVHFSNGIQLTEDEYNKLDSELYH